jgi:hypothetical protein
VALFRRRQQAQPGGKPQRYKFDRELYELARTAAGPDSAAGAATHPDAIRLLGTRAAEHRRAIQDAGLEDDDRGLTFEQLRRDYPRVFQAEIFMVDVMARNVMFGAISDDPAVGPGTTLAELAISALDKRQSLAQADPEGQLAAFVLDTAVLGHVFYRYGDLEHAIPTGRKAMELCLGLIEAQRSGTRPILVLTLDVMTFIRIETGEVPLAMQALEQALVHLDVLAAEGRDVSSALAFHRKLRAAF